MAKTKSAAKSKRRSPLQTAYASLRKVKGKHCKKKATTKQLNSAKKTYIDRAVKAGQSKTVATAKANRVIKGKCSV